MANRIQIRRGTASEWISADPILTSGEIGFESDTYQFKIGDGTSNWTGLGYFNSSTTPEQSNPVENEYSDITELLADQGNQTATFFQYVIDASDDPNVASGEAYYEKLSGSTSTLADDYRLLTDTEVEIIRDSNSYRVFRIQALQDDGTPLTSVNGGRVSFEYNGVNVTGVLFNRRYTDAIETFYNTDGNFMFYNRTTRKYQKCSFEAGDWTTVNTNYYRIAIDTGEILLADLTVNDRVEFFMDMGGAGSGGGAETSVDVNQNTHGLSVGDAIRHNGTIWVKAQADAVGNSDVLGVVTVVTDVDNFTYIYSGFDAVGSYTDGTAYFLSPTVAGAIITEPTYSIGQVRQYIGTGTPSGLLIEISEGQEITSGSALTSYTPQGVDVNCVTARNALTFLTTPTSDGSDEAIHPSVVYFETAWNSYHYWMAMTPYPNSDDQEENPEILASNDGQTWVVPSPLVNPIQATPVGSTKHYSDTCLVYNPDLNTLFCFYRYSETPAVEDRVYVQSSTDGTTWSSQTAIYTGYAFAELLSPSFYYQDGTYTMMAIDYTATPNDLLVATSTVAESGWSTPTAVTTLNLPSGRDLWQLQVNRFFNETHIFAVMCDVGTAGVNTTLRFAKTIDNDTITFADSSFIGDSSGGWDDYLIYTGCGVYNSTKSAYEFWYSAREGSATTTAWQTGYTLLKLNDCPLVEDTGTSIDLSSSDGTYYNMSSANTATTYTIFAEKTGGWAVIRVNAASEPTVTGATKIAGSTFATSTDMHLFIQYFGTTVQYFFAEL